MAGFDIDRRNGAPKYRFIHDRIREEITCGNLAAGTKLPSKRTLAEDLDVSVNTVERAYGLLVSEGYLVARQGSGFVVGSGKVDAASIALDEFEPRVSSSNASPLLDLRANKCGLDLFPFDTWARLMRRVLSDSNAALLERMPFNGFLPLRKAIAAYLFKSKGISVAPSRIVIGPGTEYLYDRLLQLLGSQSIIAVEDPGYQKFEKTSRNSETLWEHVPLDEEGIRLDVLRAGRADTVYVSPANQFPTGVVMSELRRRDLLIWAEEKPGRYIIEDDYDSEIRHAGRALTPLISRDKLGRVIYMNTFSKTLVPSIRIAYMILPTALMEIYREELSFYTCSVSSFEQMALAAFISEGYFERHIARLRRTYGKQREDLLAVASQSPLAKISSMFGGEMGTHLLFHIRTSKSDRQVKEAALSRGMRLPMLSDYTVRYDAKSAHTIVVNFAALSGADVRVGVGILEEVFAEEIAAHYKS